MTLRLLPWDYGIRNLARRPVRSLLTLVALATVVLLMLVVVGFIRGLETSLAVSGDPDVVLVYSLGAEENIENSAVPARTTGVVEASLSGIRHRSGIAYVSPELYFGTRVGGAETASLGLVRGVTPSASLVRRAVRITSGKWPGPGEVLAGRLAYAKLGVPADALKPGSTVTFENRDWTVSGTFSAGGSAFESELWCRLPDLQSALKRQDIGLVALTLAPDGSAGEIDLFAKQRKDLEITSVSETAYYGAMQTHYKPVRILAWAVVALVAGAGAFAGLNMMYGAVAGRTREIAALRAIGFRRRAVLLSLVQEGLVLAAAASLLAGTASLLLINGLSVRFTMGAFALRVDGMTLLIGCGVGLLLGAAGAVPPALKALRRPIAESLKAI
ncbi:ABC transporter permease [Alienimonas californiensis]|uniref:FtsX-like permease family protein n=1 Tax=Alienimonas californiensis TaxID=2527989 RepID=A0A517PB31_9PLAN|nr:FtsX-like permease family protein [Alienimonas californiensis]QDT16578.1 FtsX-like permease family protein [Alienimonas californiensis]